MNCAWKAYLNLLPVSLRQAVEKIGYDTLTEVMDDPAATTVETYLRLLMEHNGDGGELEVVEGLPRYHYDWEGYRYYVYAYKGNNAFWMVQIVVDLDVVDEYEEEVSRWARSVTFGGASV